MGLSDPKINIKVLVIGDPQIGAFGSSFLIYLFRKGVCVFLNKSKLKK